MFLTPVAVGALVAFVVGALVALIVGVLVVLSMVLTRFGSFWSALRVVRGWCSPRTTAATGWGISRTTTRQELKNNRIIISI